MLGGLGEFVKVDAGIVLGALQRGDKALGGGLGSAVGEGRQRGIHYVHARFDGLHVDHVAGAGGVVGVQVHESFGL